MTGREFERKWWSYRSAKWTALSMSTMAAVAIVRTHDEGRYADRYYNDLSGSTS